MKKSEWKKCIADNEKMQNYSATIKINNPRMLKPVLDNYDYERKGFFNQLGAFFTTKIFAFAGLLFSLFFRLKIVGKKNLNGLNGAIITCNHIHNLDCCLIKKAFLFKKLFVTCGKCNNYKGIGGSILRAAGTLPFGESIASMRHFSTAVSNLLNKKSNILFYAEGSMWWGYEKPRPLQDGAFFFAVKNNVPVVPMFFTIKFWNSNKTRIKKLILHVGDPIYPDPALSTNENIEKMKNINFEHNKSMYAFFIN